MRKLTGYIGAMIIVFALMGSVLLGYALNVNGTSAIVNEYEKVTDVSGLYEHTDEKSYIDYSPANNYIGYSGLPVYTNPDIEDVLPARQFYNGNTFRFYNNDIYVNGQIQAPITSSTPSAKCVLFADNTYIVKNPSNNYFNWVIPGQQILTNNITIVQNATTGALTITGYDTDNQPFGVVYSNNNLVVYYTGSDVTKYDYYIKRGTDYAGTLPLYFSDVRPIYTVGAKSSTVFTSSNDNVWYINSQTSAEIELFTTQYYAPHTYYTPNANYAYNDATYTLYHIMFPRAMYGEMGDSIGIDYTRSNRVNNYPIEYDYTSITTTQTETVNLMSVSAGDQFTTAGGLRLGQGSNYIIGNDNRHYWAGGQFQIKTGVHEYKLSDIFSTLTIPTGTTTVLIDIDLGTLYVPYANVPIDPYYYNTSFMRVNSNTAINPELTSIFPTNNYMATENNQQTMNYAIYYPDTGQVDIYEKRTGVKLYTSNINTSVVRFVDSTTTTGVFEYNYEENGTDTGTSEVSFNLAQRGTPRLNITYTINGAITNTYYMDITKGVSIKSNADTVEWNNEYENGVIDLLFRAVNNTTVYQNKLTVSNNDITVDYDGGHFYVTLNNNTRVDIGLWRNIVLNIDLVNGELNAVPVRTFNSYTNVDLDNTSIFIGDLVNAQPTNVITWDKTDKSLTFNVYSTKVFMDTYGLIMVNPTLDITQYFTDLNQFYRLKMYNFATYGDSITINGETLPVNNSMITYDNKTLELRNFSVTYADGKVSIGDNHTSLEMGDITTTTISMAGAWYFITELERGYTSEKVIYNWDWGTFILDNTQFCVLYLGFIAGALIVARKFCNLSILDYAVVIVSVIIALGVQVIA